MRLHCAESLGIETYFPKIREQRVIRRVKRTVVRPMFPRYVFCRFEPALHYRAVRYAPDVIDIVQSGQVPTVVQDRILADLKSWAGDVFNLDTRPAPLRAGDVVVIGDGPLMGLRAIVQHNLSESDRVAVLLAFLDCGARTVVPRDQLQLVG